MMSSSWMLALAAFGCVSSASWLLMTLLDRYQSRVNERLNILSRDSKRASRGLREADVAPSRTSHPWRDVLNRLVPDGHADRQRHQLRLVHAGIYTPNALTAFFAVKLLMMVTPLLIGLLAAGQHWIDLNRAVILGGVCGCLGMLLPAFWLDRKIAARHRVLRHSLPDFLDLMIICLESGLSLQGSIQRVGDELRLAHPILAGEMNIVQRDIELGTTVDTALRRFAERSGFDGVRTLSTFVREAQRFGTELADALRMHADLLRTQSEHAAEEQAQRACVKILIPTMLLILPAVFVVVAGPAVVQIHAAFTKG